MSRSARPRLTPLRRHVAAIITIALSTAFVAVLILAGNLMIASLRAQAESSVLDAEIVAEITGAVDPEADPSSAGPPEIKGTEHIWPAATSSARLHSAAGSRYLELSTLPPAEVSTPDYLQGGPASGPREIVLDENAAEALEVGTGDTIEAESYQDGSRTDLTVTGVIAPRSASTLLPSSPQGFLTEANAEVLTGMPLEASAYRWFATVAPGEDPQQVADAASTDDLTVDTAREIADTSAQQNMAGLGAMGAVFSVFVVVALLTAAVVVGNTFTVTLAQRTRDLALLRTLGATRRQVGSTVRGESLRVGLLGSALGMILGHITVQAALAAAAVIGWVPGISVVPVSALSVLLPLAAGVLITVLSGIAPLRRATRVMPLEALRPIEASSTGAGRARTIGSVVAIVLGFGLLLLGTGLSLTGTDGIAILVAVIGGIVSFTAALVGLVVIAPAAVSLLGRLVRRVGGVPASVAAANTARHPRRSAATISALLIGTTLMTMMAVGAHTAEVSLTRDLDNRKPIDSVVRTQSLPADAEERLAAIPGVQETRRVPAAELDVDAEDSMTLLAPTAEQIDATAVRDDLSGLMADGVLLTGGERAQRFGLHDGQVLEVPGAEGGTVSLRVVLDGNLDLSLVTPETLASIATPENSRSTAVFIDMADPGTAPRGDLDAISIVLSIQEEASSWGVEDLMMSAEGAEREQYGQILDVLLGITLGLLAVAVVVALVGVANTLSLGVVERTGENALLRALGTRRSQMRAMLAWEGVLLAAIGAVLGVVLGMIYGTTGVMALFGDDFPTVVTVPWVQVSTVVLLTLLAGLVASVLPARRAARVAPAQALAETIT